LEPVLVSSNPSTSLHASFPHTNIQSISRPYPKLSDIIPDYILGCAAFSAQLNFNPNSLPVKDIIERALQLGYRAFDTSPYYGDSEFLLGRALKELGREGVFQREKCLLSTKVGRIAADQFDYSRGWVRQSIERSLERFGTDYLDVVFCHDVEFVTPEEVFEAVSTLYEFVDAGKVRYVGISGYPIPKLLSLATMLKERCGRSLDVIQNYCQFTIQNTTLEKHISQFYALGVDAIFTASPLAMGLLRKDGVPVAELGDFHPAPRGLRSACQAAAGLVDEKGDDLASLAVRFIASRWSSACHTAGGHGAVILGGSSSIWELEENQKSIERATDFDQISGRRAVNLGQLKNDESLVAGIRSILGEWVDFSWESPPPDFVRKTT